MSNAVVKTYDFLKARSANELARKIRAHQVKSGTSYKYQIYSDGEYHFAWYYGEVEIKIKEADLKKGKVSVKELV